MRKNYNGGPFYLEMEREASPCGRVFLNVISFL
jgi:hypothetical protein